MLYGYVFILFLHLNIVLSGPFMVSAPMIYPENNRKNTSGFRGFSDGVGREQLPEMGQSLTGFM